MGRPPSRRPRQGLPKSQSNALKQASAALKTVRCSRSDPTTDASRPSIPEHPHRDTESDTFLSTELRSALHTTQEELEKAVSGVDKYRKLYYAANQSLARLTKRTAKLSSVGEDTLVRYTSSKTIYRTNTHNLKTDSSNTKSVAGVLVSRSATSRRIPLPRVLRVRFRVCIE